jgi:hypothetical protein
MKDDVKFDIDEYKKTAAILYLHLRDLVMGDPFSAMRSGILPTSGGLDIFGGGTYKFHGIGCRFELKDFEIDIDLMRNADEFEIKDCVDSFKIRDFIVSKRIKLGFNSIDGDKILNQINDII